MEHEDPNETSIQHHLKVMEENLAYARRYLDLLNKGEVEYSWLALKAVTTASERWAIVFYSAPFGEHRKYLDIRVEIGSLQYSIYSAIRWPETAKGEEE